MSHQKMKQIENTLRRHASTFKKLAEEKSETHNWTNKISDVLIKEESQLKSKRSWPRINALRYVSLGVAAAVSLIFWNLNENKIVLHYQMEMKSKVIVPFRSIELSELHSQLDAILLQRLQQEQQALNSDMLAIKASFKL